MTFMEFVYSIGLTDFSFWGIVAFLASLGVEFIPKIKWNPWSAIFSWIGSNINKGLVKQVAAIEKKVDSLESKLDGHIEESEIKSLQETRRDILDFANACMNGRKHTQEQFEFVITQCDEYESYIEKNDIKNGVIESAIREIRRLYDKCRREHSFLKEDAQ